MQIPIDHPQRVELNDEVHARPPVPLTAPLRLSYLVLMAADGAERRQLASSVISLAARFDLAAPPPDTTHYSAEFGRFRLRWEQHTEFARYMFIAPGADDGFTQPAISVVPPDWLAALPGRTMIATHAVLVPGRGAADIQVVSDEYFAGRPLVGAVIGGGAATALTDFRIQGDGFSRLWVANHGMTQGQAGRMMQRLLEMDTYRVMALLAFPLARRLAPQLSASESELAGITTALCARGKVDETALLERLTQLEAEIESRESESHYRFGAASAYYDLVRRRIGELREERIPGLQTFQEFTERRLAPAMATCVAVAQRQESLSQRVARATQLLSTRVDIANERQNQQILASMNRRAALQLRLQLTVEGLSIAAGTYYLAGLIGYVAKGVNEAGLRVSPEMVVAVSVPLVAVMLAFGIRRIRRHMTAGVERDDPEHRASRP